MGQSYSIHFCLISVVITSTTLTSINRESKILSEYLMWVEYWTILSFAFLHSRAIFIESLLCARYSFRCCKCIFEQNKGPSFIKFTLQWRNEDQRKKNQWQGRWHLSKRLRQIVRSYMESHLLSTRLHGRGDSSTMALKQEGTWHVWGTARGPMWLDVKRLVTVEVDDTWEVLRGQVTTNPCRILDFIRLRWKDTVGFE